MAVRIITGAAPAVRIVAGGDGPPGRPGSTVCDLPVFVGGLMAPDETIAGVFISTPIRLAADRCKAFADKPPTGAKALRFTLDGVELFQIGWAPGAADGSLDALPETIGPGLLRCIAPPAQDPTFADIYILISGNRS